MNVEAMTSELSDVLALPVSEVLHRGLLALVEKELRLAEDEIATLRERYDVLSKETLRQSIENGDVPAHPAWEDYIVWKNKEAYVAELRRVFEQG
jgi:hypothetical protein